MTTVKTQTAGNTSREVNVVIFLRMWKVEAYKIVMHTAFSLVLADIYVSDN